MTQQFDLDIEHIRQLYDERRFLDAFALTGDIWNHPEVVDSYDAETLILGARLAARLGNGKFERALYRYVLTKFPQEPVTRVYARGSTALRMSVYDYLKDFETQPRLNTENPRLKLYWLCQHAILWALVRDFERAGTLLTQAEEFSGDRSWLLTSKANLAFLQDQWQQALELVEQAWDAEAMFKGGFTVSILANCLTKLGRLDEAIERLDQVVDECQSYHVTIIALWYLLAAVECAEGGRQAYLLTRCHALMNHLPDRTPLADRLTKQQIEMIRLELAMFEHDIEQMQSSTLALKSPYFKTIRENLQQHPNGKMYMGAFDLVWQKHNTCLPASIATVVPSTQPLDADELADALTYGGTVPWQALDWLKEQRFVVKPFIFTAELAKQLFQKGLGFICITEGDDWGHAMAAIGYDEATGTLILHDPSQTRQTRMIMDKIEEFFGPFSPEALAIVPLNHAEVLDSIPDSASRPLEFYFEFWKIHRDKGLSETQAILETFQQEFPEHPIAKRLQAIFLSNTGKIAEALVIQEALLTSYPDSVQCRRDLLITLKRTRDTGRILQIYGDFVERNYLPGLSQEKSYPSGAYIVDYADFLSFTSSEHEKSLKYLHQVLFREPANAAAYHSLGDVFACQGHYQESILPFTIASLLKQEDDHYARSVCDAFIQIGELQKGFEYLEQRIRLVGNSPLSFGARLTYVAALEEYGYPDQAIEHFEQAAQQFAGEPDLALFGVFFWLRMGRPEKARQLLDKLEHKGHRLYFLEAATNFYYRRGEWEKALELAEEWNSLKPGDISAFRFYSFLYAFKYGRLEKYALVQQAVQQFKNDEAFEEVYFEVLNELFLHDEKISMLRARIRRNSRDGWAWNELCHELLTKAELAEQDGRQVILTEVDEVLQECRTLGEGTFELCCLIARQKFCTGDRSEAISLLFDALERNPSHPLPYARIMDEARNLPVDEQEEPLRRLEEKLFCTVNFLSQAVDFAGKIAAQRGLAKAVEHVEQWRQKRPNDPEIALSLARLWLDYGQSRSDAEYAMTLLEPLVQRFPNHFGLGLALADTYAILQREADQILAYQKILDRDPLQTHARWQLSRVMAVSGRLADAEQLLAEGCRVMPIDTFCWLNYASFLEHQNLYENALNVLRNATKTLPGNIQLREYLINQLLTHNLTAEARKHAQELVDFYQDGAYCWFLLADTLHQSPDYSDLKQIESFYRKALSLNSALLQAIEGLVQLMVSQHRYHEAHVFLNTLPAECRGTDDAVFLNGWVFRNEGDYEAAHGEMLTILTEHPDYPRVWQLVMDWIEEDEDWERSEWLLEAIPPVLASQLDFRTRRLELLQKSGKPVEELDAEWEELCREFPENQRLQMSRFDLLIDAEQWEQAEKLLTEYERFDPNSSYLLTRKVQMLTHQNKFDEAIATALKIWTMPGDDELWPEHFAWDTLQQAGYKKEAAHAALNALLTGQRLRLRIFALLLQDLNLVQNQLKTPWKERIKSLSALFIPLRIQAYLNLMEHLHDVNWEPSEHLAATLNHLDEMKNYKHAIKHCLKHQERYRLMTPVRQSAVMLMKRTSGNTYASEIRAWMQAWRELPGVQMWAVINYILAVSPDDSFKNPVGDLKEQFESSRDSLQTLAFDHTVRFMACLYCEAALRLDDYETFSQGIEQYRTVLEDDKTEYWLPKDRHHLPKTLLLFKDLLEAENSEEAWKISQSLRQNRTCRFSWIAPTWWKLTADKLSRPRRGWMYCRLLIV